MPIYVNPGDLYKGNTIRFRSQLTGDQYEHIWYIGADTLHEPSVEVDFSYVPRPESISISHVVTFPVDSMCYPLSAGRDSTARTFDLIEYWNDLMTLGNTFRGVIVGQNDSFDIEIKTLLPDGSPAPFDANELENFGYNFHNAGDTTELLSVYPTNYYLSFDFNVPIGNLEINPITKSVTMEYRWLDFEDYVFKGRVVE